MYLFFIPRRRVSSVTQSLKFNKPRGEPYIFVFLLVYAHHGAYVVESFQVVADYLDVFYVVYAEAYGAVEDAIVGFDEDTFHIDVELL